jgi:hypothetical protein
METGHGEPKLGSRPAQSFANLSSRGLDTRHEAPSSRQKAYHGSARRRESEGSGNGGWGNWVRLHQAARTHAARSTQHGRDADDRVMPGARPGPDLFQCHIVDDLRDVGSLAMAKDAARLNHLICISHRGPGYESRGAVNHMRPVISGPVREGTLPFLAVSASTSLGKPVEKGCAWPTHPQSLVIRVLWRLVHAIYAPGTAPQVRQLAVGALSGTPQLQAQKQTNPPTALVWSLGFAISKSAFKGRLSRPWHRTTIPGPGWTMPSPCQWTPWLLIVDAPAHSSAEEHASPLW